MRPRVVRNTPDQWVISSELAHAALVSEEEFVAVQEVAPLRELQVHEYLLTGLLLCAHCGRRIEGARHHGSAAYRCRHGYSSATRQDGRPGNAFVRESQVLARMQLIHARMNEPCGVTTGPGPAAGGRGRKTLVKPSSAIQPEEVIDHLRAHARQLNYHHPTRTLEVLGGAEPFRITV
jgi:hypothetical protein